MQLSRDVIDECEERMPAGGPRHILSEKGIGLRFACLAIIIATSFCIAASVDARGSATSRKALRAARSGKLGQAVELWTRVIKRNPKSYSARVNRGFAHLLSGNVLEGLRDWHMANECAPVFAYGVYSSGFIDEVDGNAALLNYVKSLELDPDYIPSVIMIGALYLDLGHDETAIELYRLSSDLTRNPMLKNHLNHWIKSLGGEPKE